MPTHTNKRTIHGRELQQLIIEAIPALRDDLVEPGDHDRVDPHRVMRAMFDHVTKAIHSGDADEVVRCFQLIRQLIEREKECDLYVTSAIWTSCIGRFRSDDDLAKAGLAIFRELDPALRQTLYSPFTFPHTWLRETKIHLPDADHSSACLTVEKPVSAVARFVRQTSGPGHYAIVKLQLAPMPEARTVRFCNVLPESADAPLAYVEAVIEGVTRALTEHSAQSSDRGISYLRIDLLELRHHPVDSQSSDFVKTAQQAVVNCLSETTLVEL